MNQYDKKLLKEFYETFWKPYRDEDNFWPEKFEDLTDHDLKILSNTINYPVWVIEYHLKNIVNLIIADIKKLYSKIIR